MGTQSTSSAVWRTKSGQKLLISEMSTEHIQRAIYYRMRHIRARVKEMAVDLPPHERAVVIMRASIPQRCFHIVTDRKGRTAYELHSELIVRGVEFDAGRWYMKGEANAPGKEH